MPDQDEPLRALRVVVADDHHLARSGMVRTLEQAGYVVVAEESDADAALRAVAARTPDVLVVAIGLGGVVRGNIVAIARDRWPDLAVVAVSDSGHDDGQLTAWQLGASAHLARSATPDEVVATVVRASAAPTAFLGEDLLALRRGLGGPGPPLTDREAEVLRLAAEGLSVASISRRLFVADSTTKSHLSGIYRKLGVSTRAQAVLVAERWGMLR